MNVTRTNPSLKGLGCSCQDTTLRGIAGLGMDSYATLSWTPPSQSSPGGYFGNGSLGQPGTAANALANAQPDGTTPTGNAVVDAFSNDNGGAQPGVLYLDPNVTANNLSFVQAPVQSTQCKIISTLNANPLLFIGGTFALFYLLGNSKTKRAPAHHATHKGAK